jgi:hypothetical protein
VIKKLKECTYSAEFLITKKNRSFIFCIEVLPWTRMFGVTVIVTPNEMKYDPS